MQVLPPFSQLSVDGGKRPEPQLSSPPASSPSPDSQPLAKKRSGLKISVGGLSTTDPKPPTVQSKEASKTLTVQLGTKVSIFVRTGVHMLFRELMLEEDQIQLLPCISISV